MPGFFRMHSEGIGEPKFPDVLKRAAFRVAEENAVLPEPRIVHVALFRRDIEIAAKQNIGSWIASLIEQLPQTLHPAQLELVFIRSDRLTVGNVNVDDANAGHVSHQKARLTLGIIFGKSTHLITTDAA